MLFIDEAIRRTCDPSALMPPLLCGDFNAEPMSDEIRFLTAKAVIDGRSTYFQDAGAVMHDHGGVTHEPANDFQARLNVPPTRIDYVFVGSPFLRPDGAGRVLRARGALDRHSRVRGCDQSGQSVRLTRLCRVPPWSGARDALSPLVHHLVDGEARGRLSRRELRKGGQELRDQLLSRNRR